MASRERQRPENSGRTPGELRSLTLAGSPKRESLLGLSAKPPAAPVYEADDTHGQRVRLSVCAPAARGQSSQECFDAVRDEIADWICEIYRAVGREGVAIPFDGTCVTLHPTHELWSEQRDCSTHRLATIEWAWPDGDDPTLSWLLACTVACDDKAVQTSLLVQIVSRPFLLRPLHYVLKGDNPLSFLPALATRLLKLWPGEMGGWPIPTQVRTLRANAIDQFHRETLLNPARVLPVVVVNLAGPLNVRGDGLQGAQNRLLGLAELAALANSAAVQRLAKLLPDDPPWEGCPFRLYWPYAPSDAPGVQTLFRSGEVAQRAARSGRWIRCCSASSSYSAPSATGKAI